MSDVLVTEKTPLVHITLNRPHALNALTHDMIVEMTAVLNKYRDRDDIEALVFQGAGDRAFSAGGDLKMVHKVGSEWMQSDRKNPNPAWQYFREEYDMNAMIYHYPKPVISLCHGYVMGGGYGIAGNGSHIIVDDTTRFAMPETGIGFFPDVGIGWKLARCPDALGMYIALTANIFNAPVMMQAGLATHYVTESAMAEIRRASNLGEIEGILANGKVVHEGYALDAVEVKKHFDKNNLFEILLSLQINSGDFAQNTLDTLMTRAPLSLFVTFQHLKTAENEDYDTAIARDYRLACAFFSRPDIYEGIRAAVLDKDRQPVWETQEISKISQADIDYYLNFSDYT